MRFHLPIEGFLEALGFVAFFMGVTFTLVMFLAKYTCLKEKKQLYTVLVAGLVSFIAALLMFFGVGKSMERVAWWTVIPFIVCGYFSFMHFYYEQHFERGLFSLVSVPLQTVIVWSFFFNKIIVFWVRPEFILISLAFTLDEIMILVEAFILKDHPDNEVEWTSDLPVVLLSGWRPEWFPKSVARVEAK